jgi:hypothetical protein
LEKDSNYQDEAVNSFLKPFLDESGLAIHRFGLIHSKIEPDPAILEGIDRQDLANKLSQITLIQAEWLDKQNTILEDMGNMLPIVQAELDKQ